MAKTATKRTQMPNALKQTYDARMAKTKQLNIARDLAKSMKQEKIDDKRVCWENRMLKAIMDTERSLLYLFRDHGVDKMYFIYF